MYSSSLRSGSPSSSRWSREASSEIAEELGRGESATAGFGVLAQLGASLTLAFARLHLALSGRPPVPPTIREVVPGAVVATVGMHLASAGFSIYLDRFGDFNNVYGPLGAVLAFLLLVYVAAVVLLLGACVAAAWPETATEPAGDERAGVASQPARPRRTRARRSGSQLRPRYSRVTECSQQAAGASS